MPKMSGKDAMDEIKKIQPDMKVLLPVVIQRTSSIRKVF